MVIVALGVASLTALISAYRDLDTSYERTYRELDFADETFSVRSLPQTEIPNIADIDGVESVAGRLIFNTGIELPRDEDSSITKQARARLIGVSEDRRPPVNNVLILKGRYLRPGDKRDALVESHFADFYHLKLGENVNPIVNGATVDLKVAGVAASPEYLVVSAGRQDIVPSPSTFAVLFVPLPELQKLTGAGKNVNEVNVIFKSGADRSQTIADIKERLRPFGLLATTPRKDQPSNAALKMDVEGFREIAYIMPSLIFLVAMASVYMLLSRRVIAQRPQIGVAKALGYSNGPVVADYMISAVIIGLIGSLVGFLAGIPLAGAITSAYAGELGIPLVQTQLYSDVIFISILVSLAVAALAAIGPAYGAAKVAPAVAMHPDIAAVSTAGRAPLLGRLVRLPLWARLSMRSVFRARRRAFSTILGLIFSLTLVIIAWGMINSMTYMINRNFTAVELWDEVVSFNSAVTAKGPLDRIGKIDGVRQKIPAMQLPATVKANHEEADIAVIGLPPDQKIHAFQLPPHLSEEKALADGKIIINIAVAQKLKVKIGDRVKVETPLGDHRLIVGGTTRELASSSVYTSLALIKRWADTDGPLYNSVYLKVAPDRAERIQTKLYRIPGVSGVQLKSRVENDWQSLLGLFYALVGFIFIFAGAMAFALLFNVATINTLERLREFATMRSMGTGMLRISSLIMLEDIILWAIALVPGLALGWWATVQLGKMFNSDLFYFQVVIFPTGYILSSFGVLIVMILATLPAVRRIKRLNLADETRVMG